LGNTLRPREFGDLAAARADVAEHGDELRRVGGPPAPKDLGETAEDDAGVELIEVATTLGQEVLSDVV
jgi:hypothetical protein